MQGVIPFSSKPSLNHQHHNLDRPEDILTRGNYPANPERTYNQKPDLQLDTKALACQNHHKRQAVWNLTHLLCAQYHGEHPLF